ncbi:MAG: hypothetical protein IJL06_02995 [Kiritimatiellae bacterium]|nr:hypothetical protein [Kiritimatiellia bacterium]
MPKPSQNIPAVLCYERDDGRTYWTPIRFRRDRRALASRQIERAKKLLGVADGLRLGVPQAYRRELPLRGGCPVIGRDGQTVGYIPITTFDPVR